MRRLFAAGTGLALAMATLVAAPAAQTSPSSATAAALRSKGLDFGYNLDRVEARAAFEDAIAADPNHPAAYRLLAASVWVSMLFEQGAFAVEDYLGQTRSDLVRPAPSPALAAAFRQALGRARSVAEARERARPDDPDAIYQLGAVDGLEASYAATIEGRVMGSVGVARRAFRANERVLALDPARADAGLIAGLYRYAISELSAPKRFTAWLAGFRGGRERGLSLVEAAAAQPSDVQINAKFTLILLYNRESRFDDALKVIRELQRRYPRNRLLWLEEASTALRAGRFADACRAIEEGRARFAGDTRPRAPGEESRWRLTHGTALAGLHEAARAQVELDAARSTAARDWVRGRAGVESGKLADLAGDRQRALGHYRLAEQLCTQDRDDICRDDARRLIKRPYR